MNKWLPSSDSEDDLSGGDGLWGRMALVNGIGKAFVLLIVGWRCLGLEWAYNDIMSSHFIPNGSHQICTI